MILAAGKSIPRVGGVEHINWCMQLRRNGLFIYQISVPTLIDSDWLL